MNKAKGIIGITKALAENACEWHIFLRKDIHTEYEYNSFNYHSIKENIKAYNDLDYQFSDFIGNGLYFTLDV